MIRLVMPIERGTGTALDLTCPVIVCDACGKVITGSGNVLWNASDDRDLFHTHKGACDQQLDPQHELLSEELEDWIRQLAHNVETTITGRPIPIGSAGAEYTVDETRTLADVYADRPEFHTMELAAARARQLSDQTASRA